MASEPIDVAMLLLKRQTELGEHHEDFPSSQGPVTGYRALSDVRADRAFNEGLVANDTSRLAEGTNRYVPPPKAVWAWMAQQPEGLAEAKKNAEHWAAQQTNNFDRPSSVVAIRGQQDLSHPDREMHNYQGGYPWDSGAPYGPYAIPHDIPPEQVVRVR